MNELRLGDCVEVLRELKAESVDLIATDPPYGYSFMGKDWDRAVPSVEVWRECLRVLKAGAFMFVMSSPRQDCLSQMVVRIGEAGFENGFTSIYWAYASGFPKAENIAKMVMKRKGDKGTVVGTGHAGYQVSISKTRKEQGYRPNETCAKTEFALVKPTDEEAKALDGSYGGFQPKPAVEVIIVAMKPLSEKTFVDQALQNGKGVTWLDKCRIPVNPETDDMLRITERKQRETETWENGSGFKNENNSLTGVRPEGRFPANLLVTDDILNNGVLSESHGHFSYAWKDNPYDGGWKANPENAFYRSDFGSFSRYFDLDAWFTETLKKLPREVRETFPFLITPKASKSERNKGLEGLDNATYLDESRHDKNAIGCNNPRNRSGKIRKGNVHPTVKPLAVMSYLITLGSRPKDLVLDPFVGSGTTCLAAKMLGRRSIGIDNNPEYIQISEARLNSFQTLDSFQLTRNEKT